MNTEITQKLLRYYLSKVIDIPEDSISNLLKEHKKNESDLDSLRIVYQIILEEINYIRKQIDKNIVRKNKLEKRKYSQEINAYILKIKFTIIELEDRKKKYENEVTILENRIIDAKKSPNKIDSQSLSQCKEELFNNQIRKFRATIEGTNLLKEKIELRILGKLDSLNELNRNNSYGIISHKEYSKELRLIKFDIINLLDKNDK